MNKKILVTNIQRYCLHDGPGIRTTVFMKGCNLHCPWCSNPENICKAQEKYVDLDGSIGVYGKYLSVEDIFNEVLKDKMFYLQGGGVTFSGGEPLLKIREIKPLIERLKQENINVCVETALFVEKEDVEIASDIVDIFLVDFKIADKKLCHKILGGNLEIYLKNLMFLKDTRKIYSIRIPLIPHYTSRRENLEQMIHILKAVNPKQIELIQGHNLAKEKYKSLRREHLNIEKISEKELEGIHSLFLKNGFKVDICKI